MGLAGFRITVRVLCPREEVEAKAYQKAKEYSGLETAVYELEIWKIEENG